MLIIYFVQHEFDNDSLDSYSNLSIADDYTLRGFELSLQNVVILLGGKYQPHIIWGTS